MTAVAPESHRVPASGRQLTKSTCVTEFCPRFSDVDHKVVDHKISWYQTLLDYTSETLDNVEGRLNDRSGGYNTVHRYKLTERVQLTAVDRACAAFSSASRDLVQELRHERTKARLVLQLRGHASEHPL